MKDSQKLIDHVGLKASDWRTFSQLLSRLGYELQYNMTQTPPTYHLSLERPEIEAHITKKVPVTLDEKVICDLIINMVKSLED